MTLSQWVWEIMMVNFYYIYVFVVGFIGSLCWWNDPQLPIIWVIIMPYDDGYDQ